MEETNRFAIAEIFMALTGLLVCVVGVGSKKDDGIRMNGRQAKLKPTKVNDGIRMNGRQAKLKPTKVTFVDEVPEKNEKKIYEDEYDLESDCNSESSSKSGHSEREEEIRSTTVVESLVLTPDMADLMLSYLDLMNLRTLRCECTSARLLKTYIAASQTRLDEAKRLLDAIPETMSHTERKVYMLEISQYVESIFSSLEKQAVKLIKCHGDVLCDIIQEFDLNVKNIESEVQKPGARRVDSGREKALRTLEIGCLFAFMVLSAFVGFLLTRPDIGSAFGGFVLGVLNDTWNITDFDLKSVSESNSSGVGVLG